MTSVLFWKLTKTLLITSVIIVVLLLNYLFFAWLLSVIPTTPYPVKAQSLDRTLYVSTNGMHVDVVLPVEDLPEDWKTALNLLEGTQYLGVGWGDHGFYLNTPTWAELDWRIALKAILIPSPTLMHLTHHAQRSSRWYQAPVSTQQMNQLLAFIERSFWQDEAGQWDLLEGKGYGKRDFFYRAQGAYTGLYTCNVWANQALKVAQVKTAVWSPFDWGIIRYLQPVAKPS